MNVLNPRYWFSILLLSFICVAACFARPVPFWSYEKLTSESDVVAIVEPVENIPTPDAFYGFSYGHPTNDFSATDTHFKVLTVFKGAVTNELTVLHFSYSTNLNIILDGAKFVRFYVGPMQYQKRALKDGKPVGGIIEFGHHPIWIAFLKRRTDGRFEPVQGQYDSAASFRELHESSFYVEP